MRYQFIFGTAAVNFSSGRQNLKKTFLMKLFGTYLLNPLAMTKLKASTIGTFLYLQPFVAGAFAIFMGSDSLDGVKIIAALLIFFGVFLVSLKTKPVN